MSSSPLKRKFDDSDQPSGASSQHVQSRTATPPDAKRPRRDPDPSFAVKLWSETPEPQLQGTPAFRLQPRLPKNEARRKFEGNYSNEYRLLHNDEIRDAVDPNSTLNFERSNLHESQIGGTRWSVGDKERFFGARSRYGRDLSRVAAAVRKNVLEVSLYVNFLEKGFHNQQALGFDVDAMHIPAAAHVGPKCQGALERAADALAWSQFKEEIVEEIRKHREQWLITDDSDNRKNGEDEAEEEQNNHTDDEQTEDAQKEQSEDDRGSVDERAKVQLAQNAEAEDVDGDDAYMTSDLDADILRLTGAEHDNITGGPNGQPSYRQSKAAVDTPIPGHTGQVIYGPPLPLLSEGAIDPDLPGFTTSIPVDSAQEQSQQANDSSDSEPEPASDAEMELETDAFHEPNGQDDSEQALLDHSSMLRLSKHIFMNSSKPDMHWSTHLTHLTIPRKHLSSTLTGPALFRTAYEDLTRVVTVLVRRLVAAAQYQAQSRMRMMDNLHEPPAEHVTVELRDVQGAIDILGLKRNAWNFWAGLPKRHDMHWEYEQPQECIKWGFSRYMRITPQSAEACLRSHVSRKSTFSGLIMEVQGTMENIESEENEVDEDDAEDLQSEAIQEGLDEQLEAMVDEAELERVDEENSAREEKRLWDLVGGEQATSDEYWKEQAKAQGAWPLHQGLYN